MPSALIININDLPDLTILQGKESESNWEPRDRLITALTVFFTEQRAKLDYSLAGMTTFSGSFADLRASFQQLPANDVRFIISGWIKNYYEDIMLILHTPRTQLSIRTCQFIAAFAGFLGPGLFDTFAETSLNHLLKLSGSTKKIIASAAADAAKTLFATIVPHRAFPVLLSGANDKNVNCRLRSFECLKIVSERNYEDSGTMHQKIWEAAVEKVLQKGIGDANAEIRAVALNIFLIYKEKAPNSVTKFMEMLDPSTKKQLNLLLAKTSSAPKQPKAIVSTVPIAQIRKAMLKDHSSSSQPSTPEIVRSGSPVNRSTSTSPVKSTSRLSPSKSNYELSRPNSTVKRASPVKSSYDYTLTPSKSASNLPKLSLDLSPADVPMDQIAVRPSSPLKQQQHQHQHQQQNMDIDLVQSCDVFMDAQSGDNLNDYNTNEQDLNRASLQSSDNLSHSTVLFDESEDDEVILNVPNVVKSSTPATPATPRVQEVEELTMELPRKIQLELNNRLNTSVKANVNNISLPHSASSPSVSSRIKSLGLAAGTPLRAIYRNATEAELFSHNNNNKNNVNMNHFKNMGHSLLNDLIEEFCTSKDEACLKKIVALTANRNGDYDGLTSALVHKLFSAASESSSTEIKFKLLSNFFRNESFLLSSSGREIIEILEDHDRLVPELGNETVKSLCRSNLVQILIESCIELCCERVSEFKLVFLAECIKNFIGGNFVDIFSKSISPLLLALNHPNLNMRRLSINCFLEARNKMNSNTDGLLALLEDNCVGIVQKRIIEGFLRQF